MVKVAKTSQKSQSSIAMSTIDLLPKSKQITHARFNEFNNLARSLKTSIDPESRKIADIISNTRTGDPMPST